VGRRGTDGNNFKGSCPVEREFLFENLIVGAFAQALSNGGGCVINPHPATSFVFGSTREGVGKGGVAPINAGDGEGVLFTHELVGSLLPFTSEVAIGELVPVKALVSSSVGAIEDGEWKTWQSSDMYFVRGEACCSADRVIVSVLNMWEVDIPVILAFIADHS
jgi:hypothetical protein